MTPKKQLVWYVLAQMKSNSPCYKQVMNDRFGSDMVEWFMAFAANYVKWNVLSETPETIECTDENHYLLEWFLVELIGTI